MSFTLPAMLRAIFREVFEVDGRLVNTLRTMLMRPGRITSDFLENRRAAYLPPFRTYIIASVILFFCMDLLTANITFNLDLVDDRAYPAQNTEASRSGMVGRWDDRFDAVAGSPEFGESVYRHLPEVGFVILPLLALLLKILYFRSRRAVGEHLLAAVHIKTGIYFVLIVAAIGSGIATAVGWMTEGVRSVVVALAIAASVGYVGLSLHCVYASGIALSVLRTALFVLTYWILAMVGLVTVAAILVLT